MQVMSFPMAWIFVDPGSTGMGHWDQYSNRLTLSPISNLSPPKPNTPDDWTESQSSRYSKPVPLQVLIL